MAPDFPSVDYAKIKAALAETLRRNFPIDTYLMPTKDSQTWHTFLMLHPTLKKLVIHSGGDAKVFLDDGLIYRYEMVGTEPRSAGDTHGAIETDGKVVYFGGWVEAPAKRDPATQTHDRSGKHSHLHVVDESGNVKLLWKKSWDSSLSTAEFYAEVTDLLWDPWRNTLWVTRGDIQMDEHPSLRDDGIYYWDGQQLKPFRVNPGTGVYMRPYKMDMVADILIANSENGNTIYTYDFRSGTWMDYTSAIDLWGNPWSIPSGRGGFVRRFYGALGLLWQSCALIYYRGRLDQPFRAFPFFAAYHSDMSGYLYRVGGRAQRPIQVGSGVIVPVNTPEFFSGSDSMNGALVLFDGSTPRIVMQTPYVSGYATDGYYVYIAFGTYNHEPGGIVWDTQRGALSAIPVSEILRSPLTPVRMLLHYGSYSTTLGVNGYVGGIPLLGFDKKKLKVYVSTNATMTLMHYALGTMLSETENVSLSSGWNTIDLSAYDFLVAFKFDKNIGMVTAFISLEV